MSDANTLKFLASPESTNIFKWSPWEAASNELLKVSIGKDKREKDAPQIVRASSVVDASVDEVMSILIAETTERLNTSMKQFDQTFLGGEVLCTVYPSDKPYKFPSLPICTIKRTCHELEMGRSARDFVFVECCKFDQDLAQGERIGVKTMKSIKLNEVPPNVRGSSCTRAEFLEGSGIVVRTAEHKGASEIIFILRVDTGATSKMRRAAAMFSKTKPELVSRMLYFVEQIRVQVEEAVSTCGSWSEFKSVDLTRIEETRKDAVVNLPGKIRKQTGTTTWIEESAPSGDTEFELKDDLAVLAPETISRTSSGTSELSRVEQEADILESEAQRQQSAGRSVDEASDKEVDELSNRQSAEQQRVESPVEALLPHVVELSIVQSLLFEMVTSICEDLGEGVSREQDEELAEIEKLRIKMLEDEKAELIRELNQFKSIEAEKQKLQDELSKWKKKVEEYETSPEGDKPGTTGATAGDQAVKGGDGDSELLKKYQAVLAKYEAIKASIPGVEEIDCIDGTLEDAEAKLKEFAVKIQENPDDIEAENMIERIDQFIRNHPQYKMRKEKERQDWEDANLEKNRAALEEMKGIVTEDVLRMSKEQLVSHFKEKPLLAKRVDQFRKTFKAYYTDSSALAKLHVASIVQDFHAKKLDIIELRAFYACLPKVFVADNGKKKAAWRESVAEKLITLTQKEAGGRLSAAEKRNPAYSKQQRRKTPQLGAKRFGQPRKGAVDKLNPLAANLQAQLQARMSKNVSSNSKPAAPEGLLAAIKQKKGITKNGAPSFLDELKSKRPPNGGVAAKTDSRPSFLEELKTKRAAVQPAGVAKESEKRSFLDEIKKQRESPGTLPAVKAVSSSDGPSFLAELKKKRETVSGIKPKRESEQEEIRNGAEAGAGSTLSNKPRKASMVNELKKKRDHTVVEATKVKTPDKPSFLAELKQKRSQAILQGGSSLSPGTGVLASTISQGDATNRCSNTLPAPAETYTQYVAKQGPLVDELGREGREQQNAGIHGGSPQNQQRISITNDSHRSAARMTVLANEKNDTKQSQTAPPKGVASGKLEQLNKKVELLKQRKREMKAAQAGQDETKTQSKAELLKNIQTKLKKIPSKKISSNVNELAEDRPGEEDSAVVTEKKSSLKQYSSRSLIAEMLKEQRAGQT